MAALGNVHQIHRVFIMKKIKNVIKHFDDWLQHKPLVKVLQFLDLWVAMQEVVG